MSEFMTVQRRCASLEAALRSADATGRIAIVEREERPPLVVLVDRHRVTYSANAFGRSPRGAHRVGEESGSQILISLLVPFASYLLAEGVHCSGILAAVASGPTLSSVDSSGLAMGKTRIRRDTVWDTIRFIANGVIFVLLGEQLPLILGTADEIVRMTGHHEPWWLLFYVLAISISLIALRFVWVSLRLTIFRRRLSGSKAKRVQWRLVAACHWPAFAALSPSPAS